MAASVARHHAPSCRVPYMHPSFAEIEICTLDRLPSPSCHVASEFAGHFSVHRYLDTRLGGLWGPETLPVLFVPGHRANYAQARSLGTALASAGSNVRVWTVSFNEDASLFGHVLSRHAAFLPDAVRAVQRDLALGCVRSTAVGSPERRGCLLPRPVFVVGHSMGGVAAAAAAQALTVESAALGPPPLIRAVVTLGSPLLGPPLPFDPAMSRLYRRMLQPGSPGPVSLVAISGSWRDVQVPALPDSWEGGSSTRAALVTTALPCVGAAIDHDALVWCDQFIARLAYAIDALGRRCGLGVASARNISQQCSTSDETAVLRSVLTSAVVGAEVDWMALSEAPANVTTWTWHGRTSARSRTASQRCEQPSSSAEFPAWLAGLAAAPSRWGPRLPGYVAIFTLLVELCGMHACKDGHPSTHLTSRTGVMSRCLSALGWATSLAICAELLRSLLTSAVQWQARLLIIIVASTTIWVITLIAVSVADCFRVACVLVALRLRPSSDAISIVRWRITNVFQGVIALTRLVAMFPGVLVVFYEVWDFAGFSDTPSRLRRVANPVLSLAVLVAWTMEALLNTFVLASCYTLQPPAPLVVPWCLRLCKLPPYTRFSLNAMLTGLMLSSGWSLL